MRNLIGLEIISRGIIHTIIMLLVGLSYGGPALAAPVNSPASVFAIYDVLKGSIKVATISETYTRTKDGYYIESVTKAHGLLAVFKPETIQVTSEGMLTPNGLRPHTFIQQRKLDSERNTRADFDWQAKQITLNDRSGKRDLPLPTGAQDRLSVMYQFMFLDLQNMKTYELYMSNGSKLGKYTYNITPGQSVKVPFGTYQAIYLASPPEPGENRTEVWLAAENANLPCRVDITDPDGGKLSQVLTHFKIEP